MAVLYNRAIAVDHKFILIN